MGLKGELCRGCAHCIRVCPTEAIRVRQGKAEVMPHRCIQCGECIRVCPREAWTARADSLSQIKERGGNAWALLDPAVLGQFGNPTFPLRVIQAFGDVGFSSVREMGEGLEIYGGEVSNFLSSEGVVLPAISSDCPAVVQLVQVKFPSLIENLVPIIPPYEIMASRLKKGILENSMLNLYYIVPCLAKAQAAIAPLSSEGEFTGAIPLATLYNPVKAALHQKNKGRPYTGPRAKLLLWLGMGFSRRGEQSAGDRGQPYRGRDPSRGRHPGIGRKWSFRRGSFYRGLELSWRMLRRIPECTKPFLGQVSFGILDAELFLVS